MLKHFTANVFANSVGIQEFFKFNDLDFNQMLHSSKEDWGMFPHNLLVATNLSEVFQHRSVQFSRLIAFQIQRPRYRAKHIHIHLTEIHVLHKEVHLMLLV